MEKIQGLALDGEEWYSISQAATMTGSTVAALYKWLERGRLASREIVGIQCVCLSDIQRLWPAPVEA
jgi:hypothetical protein